MPRNRRFRRALLSGAVLSVAALSLAGFVGYRAIFGRTAESALSLIPADAKAVFLVDMAPLDPAQAMVFHQIDGSLDETGLSKTINEGFMSINGNHSEAAGKLSLLLRRSGAVALFDEKKGEGVALVGLTDAAAAQSILEKEGKAQFWKGLRFWTLPDGGKACLRVEGDWLVLADSGASLLRLSRVEQGQAAAIADDASLKAARASLGGAANIEGYVTASLLPDSEKGPRPLGWISFSGIVRDGGFAMKSVTRFDPASIGKYATLFGTSPLDSGLLSHLPKGAYGAVALAQPGEQVKAVEGDLPLDADSRHSMMEATGLDIDADLLPAFKGDSTLSAYPDADGGGIDGLLVVDDSHGAIPGQAAKKLHDHVAAQITKDNGVAPFVPIQIDGAQEAWRLDPKYEKDMRHSADNDGGAIDTKRIVSEKTAVWAISNGRVIASTNEALLRRAISATPGDDLAAEPLFATAFAGGAKYVFAADPSRIAGGIRKTLRMDRVDSGSRDSVDKILRLFEGLKDPLVLKANATSDGTVTGEAIVPLDWAKTIRFIGDMANKQ